MRSRSLALVLALLGGSAALGLSSYGDRIVRAPSAAAAVVLDWDALSPENQDTLIEGSDSERGELGAALGSPLSL